MKFKVKKRQLEAGDELDVEWERWADGRAWRLKRKRDFADVDPTLAMEAAGNAAQRMGKAVQAVRDRHFPDKYIWVQFADGRIRTGEPCDCGSRRLLRLHPHFLRCPQCGSMLLETAGDDEEYESRSAYQLRQLTNVHLMRLERTGDRDVYRGYGEKEAKQFVVFAEFDVEGGPLTQETAFERLAKVNLLPFDGFSDLFELSALRSGAHDWDLVLGRERHPACTS